MEGIQFPSLLRITMLVDKLCCHDETLVSRDGNTYFSNCLVSLPSLLAGTVGICVDDALMLVCQLIMIVCSCPYLSWLCITLSLSLCVSTIHPPDYDPPQCCYELGLNDDLVDYGGSLRSLLPQFFWG